MERAGAVVDFGMVFVSVRVGAGEGAERDC